VYSYCRREAESVAHGGPVTPTPCDQSIGLEGVGFIVQRGNATLTKGDTCALTESFFFGSGTWVSSCSCLRVHLFRYDAGSIRHLLLVVGSQRSLTEPRCPKLCDETLALTESGVVPKTSEPKAVATNRFVTHLWFKGSQPMKAVCVQHFGLTQACVLQLVAIRLPDFSSRFGLPAWLLSATMVKCVACRRLDAPAGCQRQFCGSCCQPPCAESVHGKRGRARGCVGSGRQERQSLVYHRAEELTEQFLRTRRGTAICSGGYSYDRVMTECMRSLKFLAKNPDKDIEAPEVCSELVRVLPPAVLQEAVDALRVKFASVRHVEPEVVDVQEPARAKPRLRTPSPSRQPSSSSAVCAPGLRESVGPRAVQIPLDLQPAMLQDAWWPFSTMSVRMKYNNVAVAEWNPLGRKPTQKDGLPCAHYMREVPPRVQLDEQEGIPFDATLDFAALADATLRSFVMSRPSLCELFERPRVPVLYAWSHLEKGFEDMHDVGRWYFLKLRKPIPEAWPDAILQKEGLRRDDSSPLTELVHSASMYTFANTAKWGLWPGRSATKGGLKGVFAFPRESLKVATSSSGYCLYSDLGGAGVYFAPRWQIMFRRGSSRYSAGSKQYACPAGTYQVCGVYIHAMTADLAKQRLGRASLWFNSDTWHPEYEEPVHEEAPWDGFSPAV
jgi:hypothetical protein